MKRYLTHLNVNGAAIVILAAILALPGQGFPGVSPSGSLRVTASGGGCTNCIGESFRYDPCSLVCSMPLSATVENKSNSGIIVKVTLAIFPPEEVLPECPSPVSDKQTLFYVIPKKGKAAIDFSHVFTGLFSDAEFRANAEVVWAESGGMVGKSDEASIHVSTAWPFCPNGPDDTNADSH